MESLLTMADNLEQQLRRINIYMRHRRKTKKLTLFYLIILRFKLEVLDDVKNNYNLLLPVSLVIIIIIIIGTNN